MKTFNDLVFATRNSGDLQARMKFDNGYDLSVVAGQMPYSTPRDNDHGGNPDYFSAFEVAVFTPNGDWATREFFPDHDDDVLGWQSRADINSLILLIQGK